MKHEVDWIKSFLPAETWGFCDWCWHPGWARRSKASKTCGKARQLKLAVKMEKIFISTSGIHLKKMWYSKDSLTDFHSSTRSPQEVTHLSTTLAQCGLTSDLLPSRTDLFRCPRPCGWWPWSGCWTWPRAARRRWWPGFHLFQEIWKPAKHQQTSIRKQIIKLRLGQAIICPKFNKRSLSQKSIRAIWLRMQNMWTD